MPIAWPSPTRNSSQPCWSLPTAFWSIDWSADSAACTSSDMRNPPIKTFGQTRHRDGSVIHRFPPIRIRDKPILDLRVLHACHPLGDDLVLDDAGDPRTA